MSTFAPTSRPTAAPTEGAKILGFDVIVFIVMIAGGVMGLVVLSIFPYIYCRRYQARRRQYKDNMEERRAKQHKRGFFNRFSRRPGGNPWVQRIDPQSNRPYYENTMTGEVSWTDPNISTHVDPNSGAPYYMNNQNGHVSWNMSSVQNGMGGGGGYNNGQVQPYQGRGPGRGPPMQQGRGPPMQQGRGPPQQRGPPPMQQQRPPPQQQRPPPPQSRAAPAAAPAAPPAGGGGGGGAANDPKFAKYSRMQKAGLPEGAIRNAMKRDDISAADQNAFFG